MQVYAKKSNGVVTKVKIWLTGGTMELFFFCLRTLGGRYSLSCFLQGYIHYQKKQTYKLRLPALYKKPNPRLKEKTVSPEPRVELYEPNCNLTIQFYMYTHFLTCFASILMPSLNILADPACEWTTRNNTQ